MKVLLTGAAYAAVDKAKREPGLPAVLHWSDAGAASWYDVAIAAGELALLEQVQQSLERAAIAGVVAHCRPDSAPMSTWRPWRSPMAGAC